jgi:hypothetical protein
MGIERPIVKLYKYEENQFKLVAFIDDYEEISWESKLYEAGTFTLQINYNIPNAYLLQKGLFIQLDSDPYKFGEISDIQCTLDSSGKGGQYRIATGFDARYLFHKRIIKNLNTSEAWEYTGKGEMCLRMLVYSQCGLGESEIKRRLPIANTIPEQSRDTSITILGQNYCVKEAYSNLYDVLVTIATQSQIGWRVVFGGSLALEVFEGTDKSQYIRFDTDYQTLDSGTVTDSNGEYTNAVYIGGQGNGADRDIYEGEEEGAEGLTRYETWIDKNELTEEAQYITEADSILRQYAQTTVIEGKGLNKSPYEFETDYNIGDIVNFAFSGVSKNVPILSVSEHWTKGEYDIDFEVGKPINDLKRQLALLLRKIQSASNSVQSSTTSSVKWYTIPTDTQMKADEVSNDVIGFLGNVGSGAIFKLYYTSNGTGAKTYHVYLKQLEGNGKLTLTTGVSGKNNVQLSSGTYVTIIYVDTDGNVSSLA